MKKNSGDIVIDQKYLDFESSLEYASILQKGILPKQRHFDRIFSESFIYFLPLHNISGDFYWLAEIDGLIYLAVGDCAGHGVPGALLSVLGASLLDYIILKKRKKKTHKILQELDCRFIESFSSSESTNDFDNDWIDISLCCIEPKKKTIYFSGARRNMLFVYDKGMKLYKGCKYPVGAWQMKSKRTFETIQINYSAGDKLYLGSDGFQDQIGGKSVKKYKSSALHKFLHANSHLQMTEQKEILEKEFFEWKGDKQQIDDLCIIGVKL